MSDMKIGMALASLTQAELATIVANQFLSSRSLATAAKSLAAAVFTSAGEAELRNWVRFNVKASVDGGTPLSSALSTLAGEHGGGSEVVNLLTNKLRNAAVSGA